MCSANQNILTYSGLQIRMFRKYDLITNCYIYVYTIYVSTTTLNLYAIEAVSYAGISMVQVKHFTRAIAAEHFLRFLLFCDV